MNAVFKSMAMDLKEKNVPVILMHLGIVKRALGPRHGEGIIVPSAVEPEEAAGKLWKGLKSKRLESTGMFFHRSEEELPWQKTSE